MFKRLWQKIREVGYRLNMIKGIKSVTDKVDVSSEHYDTMQLWRDLYRGYCKDWHNIQYVTPAGPMVRTMSTLSMPKQIASKMATLIYNERCTINISDDGYQEFVKGVLKDNKFDREFQTQLEYGFALGGLVAKGYIEDNKIKLSYVTADCFIPVTYDLQGRITEAVFVNETQSKDKKYTHLEWHLRTTTGYTIKNELYESSNREELGVKVPLNRLPQYAEIEEEVTIEPLQRPLFEYFKPNIANNIDMNSPLGISLYANALSTLRDLDQIYDSLKQEFKLGRKRIIVPSSALKGQIDTQTGEFKRYFDPKDEVYEGMAGDMDAGKIQDISTPLRVQEHIDAINAQLKILSMQIGMSPGTFTFDASGLKTATEVVSENSETFRTKQSHETMVEAFITGIVEIIGLLGALTKQYSVPADYEVTVAFDDSIAEDATAEANRQILLVGAGLQSKVQALIKLHGLSVEEAEKLLMQINSESQVTDMGQLDGV